MWDWCGPTHTNTYELGAVGHSLCDSGAAVVDSTLEVVCIEVPRWQVEPNNYKELIDMGMGRAVLCASFHLGPFLQ